MEEIKHDGHIIALILRSGDAFPGITFFTPPEFSQQLGFLNHKAGHHVQPHTHRRVERQVVTTQEVLMVRRGRVKVILYTSEKKLLKERILETGDLIFLASGGHGLEILEDTQMIEVKQGPYIKDIVDKTRFEIPGPDGGEQ